MGFEDLDIIFLSPQQLMAMRSVSLKAKSKLRHLMVIFDLIIFFRAGWYLHHERLKIMPTRTV